MINEIVYSSIASVPVRAISSPYSGGSPTPPHRASSIHFHNEIELLRIEAGVFSCTAAGQAVTAHRGDVIYIASNVPHETQTLEYGTYSSLLQFSLKNYTGSKTAANKSLYSFINNNEVPVYLFKTGTEENSLISSYLDDIYNEIFDKKPGYEHYVTACIHSIIGLLYRLDILKSNEDLLSNKYIDKIMPALNYIDQNYSEQITLEALSSASNMNPSYFCRTFKKATSATFTEYLNFVRVLKSEQLLASGAKGISDIALDVGFSSVSYYNRIFKRVKGISPTAYRKAKLMQVTHI